MISMMTEMGIKIGQYRLKGTIYAIITNIRSSRDTEVV